jgi:ATPase subunit of ABC transporter with duplicated ATPase domains
LADKDISDRPRGLHRIKKGMMVSDNIELDFGIARPVLVSGNQGLQAKGVGKSFNKRRVVRNVSLGLQRGEAVGLLGPNGRWQNNDILYACRFIARR